MIDTTLFDINDEFIRNLDSEVVKITSIDRSRYPVVWFMLRGDATVMSITNGDLSTMLDRNFLTPIKNNSCQHEWKSYIGFTESFKYCIKCNEKDKA